MNALTRFLDKVLMVVLSFALGMITMYVLFMNELQSYIMLHKP